LIIMMAMIAVIASVTASRILLPAIITLTAWTPAMIEQQISSRTIKADTIPIGERSGSSLSRPGARNVEAMRAVVPFTAETFEWPSVPAGLLEGESLVTRDCTSSAGGFCPRVGSTHQSCVQFGAVLPLLSVRSNDAVADPLVSLIETWPLPPRTLSTRQS